LSLVQTDSSGYYRKQFVSMATVYRQGVWVIIQLSPSPQRHDITQQCEWNYTWNVLNIPRRPPGRDAAVEKQISYCSGIIQLSRPIIVRTRTVVSSCPKDTIENMQCMHMGR
jgi:hypothetical protein